MNVFQGIVKFLVSPLKIGGISFFFSPLKVLLQFILPILVLLVVYKLLLLLLRRLILKPIKIKEETKDKIYRYSRLALRITAFILFFFIAAGFFETEIPLYIARIWEILRSPLITVGNSTISIITFILAIPVFYLASWIARLTKRFVDSTILNQMSIEEAVRFTISSLIRYGVMILAILIGLSMIGLNLSSLAVLFGVLGIGVGFGLQSVVSNFFSGLVIIFERPIREGDRILVDGLEGDVIHIRLRSTIINTLTNETIIVPNSQLVGHSIHNYSYQDKRIVIVNAVQVSYSTDLEKAREVLLGVAERNPYALKQPPSSVKVIAFQDSGILLELWTWISEATQKLTANSWVNLEIWREFKKAGIEIPFPQVDLHVKETLNIKSGPQLGGRQLPPSQNQPL